MENNGIIKRVFGRRSCEEKNCFEKSFCSEKCGICRQKGCFGIKCWGHVRVERKNVKKTNEDF